MIPSRKLPQAKFLHNYHHLCAMITIVILNVLVVIIICVIIIATIMIITIEMMMIIEKAKSRAVLSSSI